MPTLLQAQNRKPDHGFAHFSRFAHFTLYEPPLSLRASKNSNSFPNETEDWGQACDLRFSVTRHCLIC